MSSRIQTYFEDGEIIVSNNSVIAGGERIPAKSIKKVTLEDENMPIWTLGYMPSRYKMLTLELGAFKKRVICRESIAASIYTAARCDELNRKTPGFIYIADHAFGVPDDDYLELLRKDPKVTASDLDRIVYLLGRYKRMEAVHEAIKRAMAKS